MANANGSFMSVGNLTIETRQTVEIVDEEKWDSEMSMSYDKNKHFCI